MSIFNQASKLLRNTAQASSARLHGSSVWGGGAPVGYDANVLADSPLVYLKLDETSGTVAHDSSGNGHDFTYVGTFAARGVGTLSGLPKGTTFGSDPSLPHVEAPNASLASFAGPGVSFTIEGWFTGQGTGSPGLVTKMDWDLSNGWHLEGPWPLAEVYADNGASDVWTQPPNSGQLLHVDDGVLHHVVMRVTSGGTIDLFFDGALINSSASVSPSGTANAIPAWLGQYASYPGAASQFKGTMTAVAIYPTALSSARIAAHHAAGTA